MTNPASPTDTPVDPISPPPMDPAPTPLVADESDQVTPTQTPESSDDIRGILHKKCGKVTELDKGRGGIGESLIRHPGIFHNLPCDHCGGNHPAKEFTWRDGTPLPAPEPKA